MRSARRFSFDQLGASVAGPMDEGDRRETSLGHCAAMLICARQKCSLWLRFQRNPESDLRGGRPSPATFWIES
jgi:hypothetical protein